MPNAGVAAEPEDITAILLDASTLCHARLFEQIGLSTLILHDIVALALTAA
jgi:hypothetical protein